MGIWVTHTQSSLLKIVRLGLDNAKVELDRDSVMV